MGPPYGVCRCDITMWWHYFLMIECKVSQFYHINSLVYLTGPVTVDQKGLKSCGIFMTVSRLHNG